MDELRILSQWLRQYWSIVTVMFVVTATVTVETKVIETLSGSVRGSTKNVIGVDVDTYLGIPFADPPLGLLRFRAPKPVQKWTGVKDVLTLPNSCMQSVDTSFNRFSGVEMWNANTNISEDCLYLNLWVPRASPGTKLATIVWIYGGSYVSGSATLDVYDGTFLAAKESVIVASMQYRLGVHGFLYSGTDEAPGNMGLFDQQLAMKWIHDNIKAFNGDDTKITLMGESAGSASVSHHLIASSSWPFFNNAIMLSATSLARWATDSSDNLLNNFHNLAKLMGCDKDNKEDILECLREADVEDLEAKQWEVESKTIGTFSPVIDGTFLKDTPDRLIASGNVKNTNIILGNTKDEGEYFLIYSFQDAFKPENLWNPTPLNRSEYEDVVRRIGDFKVGVELDSILYTYEYSNLPSKLSSYRDILDDIFGDYLFKCSVHDFAEGFSSQHPAKGRTYVYSFEYRHSVNPWPPWMGVLHGYEIEMAFGLPFNTKLNYSSDDRKVSAGMMQSFTSFAKTGSPTYDLNSKKSWPEYDSQSQRHLVFSQGTQIIVKDGFRHKECSFWKDLFPKIRIIEDRLTVNCSGGIYASGMIILLISMITKLYL